MKTIKIFGNDCRVNGPEDDPYFQNLEGHVSHLSSFKQVLRWCLPKDAVGVDIGANIGITSLIMSRYFSDGRVISCEPSVKNFHFLEQNLAENCVTNCNIYNLAIGANDGDLLFHESNYGAGSHVVSDAHMAPSTTPSITVPVKSLDSIVFSSPIKNVDFVKIDVEGFEYDVLNGMKKTIQTFRPLIFMEFNSWTVIAFRNQNPRVLLDLFLELCPSAYAVIQPDHHIPSSEGSLSQPRNFMKTLSTRLARWRHSGSLYTSGRKVPHDDELQLRSLKSESNCLTFLHDNLVNHRCVDDLIGSLDPERLTPLLRQFPIFEEVIDFTKEVVHGPAIMVLEGVSIREEFGRWTDGERCVITFSAPLPRSLSIRLDTHTAFGPNKKLPSTIRVGSIEHKFIVNKDGQSFHFDFVLSDDFKTIEVFPAKPTPPKQLGISEDNRKLGLALKAMKVTRKM